jgi:hypothetical protein
MPLTKTRLCFIASVKKKIHKAQYNALKVVDARLIDINWDSDIKKHYFRGLRHAS